MDFLMKYNITDKEIEEILNYNSNGIINNIIINKENVMEVIDYLLGLGIKMESIKELLIYQIGIFFRTKEELITSFEEYEMDSIVKSINYDINTVDMIEF